MVFNKLEPKSNIANKVRNTKLPTTKPLMPLFEAISNSIHAINDAKDSGLLYDNGEIKIIVIRQGEMATFKEMENIDFYPVKSFEISDNGIGLNDENLNGFVETDTDHKIEIGGKGVGRFVCLKAFKKLNVKSHFIDGQICRCREFIFTNTKDGFSDFKEEVSDERKFGTTIILTDYKEEFKKHVPRPLSLIVTEIINHFQLYFIQNEVPKIIVSNQNGDFINCATFFDTNFKGKVKSISFFVSEFEFRLYLTKSTSAQSHKIFFCAHNRVVREEGLINRIIDLGRYPISDEEGKFYYQAFVVGEVFDDNVDLERVGFNFPMEESDEDFPSDQITLAKIRKEAINTIEILLADYLNIIRDEKIANYRPIIQEELPQYNHVLTHKLSEVKKLQPNLPKDKLDIELYKIETEWKFEVKEEGAKLIDEKKDIQNLDEYKQRYEKFLSDFNEVGKADLARYVVHRKAVIQLLETLLEKDNLNKFADEDIIHSLFFPIKSTSDEVTHDKQNLWLIDERLTYHSFLASDKKFNQIRPLNSDSDSRADLLIYNDALAFSEDKLAPFQSFTIVEFKKPQREGYQDFDPKRNPLDQVEKYIKEILDGKVISRTGRKIIVDSKMPFYVYIICDLNSSLIEILHSREFDKTTDGQGYFKMYTKYFNAYVEVLPFEKVLSDAKKRNRILFEKLGIPQ
jgi:hypothetical protein